jgi:hypothetical protein
MTERTAMLAAWANNRGMMQKFNIFLIITISCSLMGVLLKMFFYNIVKKWLTSRWSLRGHTCPAGAWGSVHWFGI